MNALYFYRFARYIHIYRTVTVTSVSVESISSLHELKICSLHRFYDSSVAEISLALHLLI